MAAQPCLVQCALPPRLGLARLARLARLALFLALFLGPVPALALDSHKDATGRSMTLCPKAGNVTDRDRLGLRGLVITMGVLGSSTLDLGPCLALLDL